MYLVTLQQRILGSDPVLLPSKKLHFTNAKELADWCHAFIRACAEKGWLKEEITDRMLDGLLMPQPLLLDIRRQGLARHMMLRNEDSHKEVTIEIEHLAPVSPSRAAHDLTR